MRRADPVIRAGLVCQDLSMSFKHTKNQLYSYMEKSQPGQVGSRYRNAGIPTSWAENLSYNRNCRANPASRANTFLSLNFTSEQNG